MTARNRTVSGGPSRPSSRRSREPVVLGRALTEAFLTNERVNQVLLDLLDPKIWRDFPPCSKRRNIATTFAHIHNVRRMRLVMSAKDKNPPVKLDRGKVTLAQARKALATSCKAMVALIERSLESGGYVENHQPNVVVMVMGAIAHEAHHRGQVCHWARELGAPLSPEDQLQIWEWDKRWKEIA